MIPLTYLDIPGPSSQVVASGVLYIAMHGNPDKNCLIALFEPLLKKLAPASWEVLDREAMQQVRKPVWYQVTLPFMLRERPTSKYEVRKIFGFFIPSPFSVFGTDLFSTNHATSLLWLLFHDTPLPLECGRHIWTLSNLNCFRP